VQNINATNLDPNTTKQSYLFTNHKNSPDSNSYWHITTSFHPSKENYRSQIASRSGEVGLYARTYDGGWTEWEDFFTSSSLDLELDDLSEYLKGYLDDVIIDYVRSEELNAQVATINQAIVNKADIEVLNAAVADIGNINADIADIQSAMIGKADIGQLNALYGNIQNLESGFADIDTLLAGNLTAENLQANSITAGSGVIADGAILDAMIVNLDVNKLLAGNISTNKFNILSDSGNFSISENTMKVWDNSGRERISLGKNGTDYNLLVRGADGQTVLFGADGVTNAGITYGAVDDSKVAENANISGSKLNIESLVHEINDGTELLESSKVNLDGQHLNVAFSQLSNTVSDNESTMTTKFSDLEQDIEGFKTTVSSTYLTKAQAEANSAATTAEIEAARLAAEAYALAQAELERIKAEAYADGIVEEEERERINEALETRQLAKNTLI
jgi:hypothetical protein